jgi:TubC N-terminal docking domain
LTALALLQQLRDLSMVLTPYPDGILRYKAPKGVLTPAVLDGMRQHKAELHALVEEWSERAAMAEYCGGLSREEAERVGWIAVLGTA